jgi:hypothetical protein
MPGQVSAVVEIGALAPGIYVIAANADGKTINKKMVVYYSSVALPKY